MEQFKHLSLKHLKLYRNSLVLWTYRNQFYIILLALVLFLVLVSLENDSTLYINYR